MLALVFAKLARKFVVSHTVLSVFDLLISRRIETLGQLGPGQSQIGNISFFRFKRHVNATPITDLP